MKVRFLGTSGSGINLERKLPAILVDDQILVDCGEGTVQSLLELRIPISNIKYIFITHLHADHVLGLVGLLWKFAFYSKTYRKAPEISIPIYIPWGMKEKLDEILENTYSTFDKVNFKVDIQELPTKCDYSIPISILHQNKKKRQQEIIYSVSWLQTIHEPICYAYRFDNKIVISGDTSPSKKMKKFCKGVDTLVHEATFFDEQSELAHNLNHSTPTDAALIALNNQITQVYLTHLPNLKRNQKNHFLRDAREVFPNVHITSDWDILFID